MGPPFTLAMINNIDHLYIFTKSLVVVLESLWRWPFNLKVFPSLSCIVIAPCDETPTTRYGPSHLLRSFPWPNNFTLELKSNTLSPELKTIGVAAPPDINRLKCANHHQTTIRVNTHLKRSNPAVLSGKIPIKPLETGSTKQSRACNIPQILQH